MLKKMILKKKTNYIFILDITDSIYNVNMPITWYKSAVQKINDNVEGAELSFLTKPSCLEICKIKLMQQLLDIVDSNSEFSIWTLGTDTRKVYPNNETGLLAVDATKPNIYNAIITVIKNIENTVSEKDDDNTDFISLFKKINHYYLSSIVDNYNQFEMPSTILVIISDLIHDVENLYSKNQKDEDHENNSIELTNEIIKLSKSNILANLVVLEEVINQKFEKYKINIFKSLKNFFDPNCFETISIKQEEKLPYTKIRAKKNLKFYYTNKFFIKNSTTKIKFSKRVEGEYKISLRQLIKNLSIFQLDYQILLNNNKKKEGKSYKGKLIAGRSAHIITDIQHNEKVEFTYSGRLPESNNQIELLLYLPRNKNEEKRAYIISIDFIKKLTTWSASLIFISQFIVFFSALFLLLYSIISYIYKKKQ